VDACQFRIAPSTLRAYLELGFMVALTGSKFVTGPPFSGALLIPAPAASRLRGRPLPGALSAYSTRADWPENWDTNGLPDNVANFGLLLRWEAALEELRAFRLVPEAEVANFLQEFARAIRKRLAADPVFEPLPVPAIDRFPLSGATGWDHIQTIFPFLLFHPPTGMAKVSPLTMKSAMPVSLSPALSPRERGTESRCANFTLSHAGKLPLNREETTQIYRLLQVDLSDRYDDGAIAALRCQLGQPVACGNRGDVPVSALRLCASARLVVEATAQGGRNVHAVIEKAVVALDKTALLVLSGWNKIDR